MRPLQQRALALRWGRCFQFIGQGQAQADRDRGGCGDLLQVLALLCTPVAGDRQHQLAVAVGHR